MDGEKLLGLDDQIEALKKSDAYLFETEEKQGGMKFDSGKEHKNDPGAGADASMRAAFGLPAEK